MFVQEAGQFKSSIRVVKGKVEVNGKSIMGLLLLEAALGTKLILKIEGPDEKEAAEALGALFVNKFDEE